MMELLRSKLRELAARDAREHAGAEALAAFAEGRLNSKQRANVIVHLGECGGCRDVLSLVATQKRGSPGRCARWLATAAALTLICTGGIWLHNHQQRMRTADYAPADILKAPDRHAISINPATARISLFPSQSEKIQWRIDKSQGWATLAVSRDQGLHWQPVPMNQFRPKSVAWKEPMVWVQNAQGAVMESRDNGVHWKKLP